MCFVNEDVPNASLKLKSTTTPFILCQLSFGKGATIGFTFLIHDILFHIGIFRSLAYLHILDKKRQKLEPTSEKCILVGYSLEQKGYKCYNPSTRKVRVSRDVVFDELTSWYEPKLTPPEPFMNDLDNTKDDDQLRLIFEESPISTRLSGPQNPRSDQSTSRLSSKMDKGKPKMPKHEDSMGIESNTHLIVSLVV